MKKSTLLLFVMMALASEHSEHSEPWCIDFNVSLGNFLVIPD